MFTCTSTSGYDWCARTGATTPRSASTACRRPERDLQRVRDRRAGTEPHGLELVAHAPASSVGEHEARRGRTRRWRAPTRRHRPRRRARARCPPPWSSRRYRRPPLEVGEHGEEVLERVHQRARRRARRCLPHARLAVSATPVCDATAAAPCVALPADEQHDGFDAPRASQHVDEPGRARRAFEVEPDHGGVGVVDQPVERPRPGVTSIALPDAQHLREPDAAARRRR